jgi:hypothetical protein
VETVKVDEEGNSRLFVAILKTVLAYQAYFSTKEQAKLYI